MTNDKRNQNRGGQAQQGQQQGQAHQQAHQQGQLGQGMQADRQQSQQGRADETDSLQNIRGEGSGSNRQAQQAHRDPMERLQSGQRSGGLADEGRQFLQSGSVPRVPRQAQAVQGIADQNAAFSPQPGQQPDQQQGQQQGEGTGVRESGDRGAMAQTSLPGGFKSSRTWTQTSGGQQATQTSLEGGQHAEPAADTAAHRPTADRAENNDPNSPDKGSGGGSGGGPANRRQR